MLELVVAIEVGRWVGALPTIGALLVVGLIGAMIVRRQGAAAWRTLNSSLQAGQAPSRELAAAAVKLLAGMLLILPGFVTDIVAVLLLLPPTRLLVRRPIEQALDRAAANRVTLLGSFPGAGRAAGGFGRPAGQFGQAGGQFPTNPFGGGDVVEGQVVDDSPDDATKP